LILDGRELKLLVEYQIYTQIEAEIYNTQQATIFFLGGGELKGQLDKTDGSLLQNLLFAQHVSGTNMPIIRSSRVLYRWLLPVVLDTQPTAPHQTDNL
jgi:hypothetical protein